MALAAAATGAAADTGGVAARSLRSCTPPLTGAYTGRVMRALRARRDIWGEQMLGAPQGPTYAAASRFLHPLLLARAPGKRPLTESGVHYAAFGWPSGSRGTSSVALHVADGGQIVARRVGGRHLDVFAGRRGRERYGSCLGRLGGPRLADGWLPILRTAYRDAAGVRYEQESFTTRGRSGGLVTFVRIDADSRGARSGATIALRPSGRGLRRIGNELRRGSLRELAFSPGARYDRRSIRWAVPRGSSRSVFAVWRSSARPAALPPPGSDAHDAARTALADYWQRRLREGASIEVPERRVMDALRGLLVQDLTLTWRYSVGNPYEQFSFPEGVDVARVLGELGYADVERSMLRTSFGRRSQPYANWKRGQRLVAVADHYARFSGGSFLREATPTLRAYVDAYARQLSGNPRSLLARERYSSDIPLSVYGLHAQAVAWQGLVGMASAWDDVGDRALARRCRALAARLQRGLRSAVRTSARRLPGGALFLPARLLDGEPPYRSVTEARLGSYWNLVTPYALASGLFAPGGSEARGAMRYLESHGAWLLGLVRAGAYALYREPRHPVSGTDHVYGIQTARFLADQGAADRLVVALYGALAAGMAPGTFVSGEAASVAPLGGEYFRAAYLPPNTASNAAYLVTLRHMLVHERRAADGTPVGLQLAFSTPRAWLRPGRRIAVRAMPTSFGEVSYELSAGDGVVRATVDAPPRIRPSSLRLRVRLPAGRRFTSVTVGGRPHSRFDARSGTVDLSGLSGRLDLTVRHAARSSSG
jgi:hypothetical protein